MTPGEKIGRLFAGTALHTELDRLARLTIRAAGARSRISADGLADDLLARLHRSRNVRALRAKAPYLWEISRAECVATLAVILRRRWGSR